MSIIERAKPRRQSAVATRAIAGAPTAAVASQPPQLGKWIDPAQLPDEYGMIVEGDCLAPQIPHGTVVHIHRRLAVAAGDLVLVYFKREVIKPGSSTRWLKRLVMAPPPWVTFPWTEHPTSELGALMICEMDNPRSQFTVPCDAIEAVHRCVGPLARERVAGRTRKAVPA